MTSNVVQEQAVFGIANVIIISNCIQAISIRST